MLREEGFVCGSKGGRAAKDVGAMQWWCNDMMDVCHHELQQVRSLKRIMPCHATWKCNLVAQWNRFNARQRHHGGTAEMHLHGRASLSFLDDYLLEGRG